MTLTGGFLAQANHGLYLLHLTESTFDVGIDEHFTVAS